MAKQDTSVGRAWYAIHTYAGYENAVARNLRQRIESLGLQERIFNVVVPTERTIKIKGGRRVEEDEKVYPGYALVIVDGPFKDLDGKVGEVDESRGKVKVLVAMFGRETPVELDFLQVKRI